MFNIPILRSADFPESSGGGVSNWSDALETSSSAQITGAGMDKDRDRFRKIVRGKVRDDLKRFMGNEEFIGRQGGDVVHIPLPDIELPHFEYFSGDGGGVGEGEGEGQGGQPGKPGDKEGKHGLEATMTVEELAEIMGEALELPRIKPRGTENLEVIRDRYNTIANHGPESLIHPTRTFKQAMKRQLAEGTLDVNDPVVTPIKDDYRFKAATPRPIQRTNAAIIYNIDVSGSMGDEQKAMARLTAYWIDMWLDLNYRGCEKAFIIHDVVAQEVDRDTFFRTKEDGGTRISSAYEKSLEVIKKRFPPDQWNIYMFHFSDGDNSSDSDNAHCVSLLKNEILPLVNLFGYVQTKSQYGSGGFENVIRSNFRNDERVVNTGMNSKNDVPKTIKDLLSSGR